MSGEVNEGQEIRVFPTITDWLIQRTKDLNEDDR